MAGWKTWAPRKIFVLWEKKLEVILDFLPCKLCKNTAWNDLVLNVLMLDVHVEQRDVANWCLGLREATKEHCKSEFWIYESAGGLASWGQGWTTLTILLRSDWPCMTHGQKRKYTITHANTQWYFGFMHSPLWYLRSTDDHYLRDNKADILTYHFNVQSWNNLFWESFCAVSSIC